MFLMDYQVSFSLQFDIHLTLILLESTLLDAVDVQTTDYRAVL